MIDKESFKDKYGISEMQIKSSGLTWEDLCLIYHDYEDNKVALYRNVSKDFVSNYLTDFENPNIPDESRELSKIHSVRYRIKDPEHLIEKIIRRKIDNFKKYRELTTENYEYFVTDLIGIRCFVLFKADWQNVHRYLISNIKNDPELYITSPLQSTCHDDEKVFFSERPKAHIRNGDSRDIYEELLEPDAVLDDKVYRSVHYVVRYKKVYLEIQVRTLFEEGWGEVDHAIVYPYFKNDPFLKEYTELLNRLSGLADEMGSFFCKAKLLEQQYLQHQRSKNQQQLFINYPVTQQISTNQIEQNLC